MDVVYILFYTYCSKEADTRMHVRLCVCITERPDSPVHTGWIMLLIPCAVERNMSMNNHGYQSRPLDP